MIAVAFLLLAVGAFANAVYELAWRGSGGGAMLSGLACWIFCWLSIVSENRRGTR